MKVNVLGAIGLAFLSGFCSHAAIESVYYHQDANAVLFTMFTIALTLLAFVAGSAND